MSSEFRRRAATECTVGADHRWQRRPALSPPCRRAILDVRCPEHDGGGGAKGIGSCPAHLPERALAGLLGIPSEIAVNRVIGFGDVDVTRAAAPASVARRRRPLTELVHWETW